MATDSIHLAKHFGFKSGREHDKFKDIAFELSDLGLPLLKETWQIFSVVWWANSHVERTHCLSVK